MPFRYAYPRPALTVDCVVFGLAARDDGRGPALLLLLVERGENPFKGSWALPGGFVEVSDAGSQGESLDEAARRELREETGVEVAYLEQLHTFGTPGRDPRGRTVSVAYYALVRSADQVATAGSDARSARWFSMTSRGPDRAAGKLAFDHHAIVSMALERLQSKVRHAPIGFSLLPARFSLTQLQALYEAILMRPLDRRNFRKRILSMGILREAGRQQQVAHRAATLYRFDRHAYNCAVRDGFHFEV
ncbi:MAG: NUDIX domain-containing protein [Polyangiaceae bacterium]|jgi:8-oxo-dGTP diphosphatase